MTEANFLDLKCCEAMLIIRVSVDSDPVEEFKSFLNFFIIEEN